MAKMLFIPLLLLAFCEPIADNPVEEWVEDVILEETGVYVDLSGASREDI